MTRLQNMLKGIERRRDTRLGADAIAELLASYELTRTTAGPYVWDRIQGARECFAFGAHHIEYV